MPCRFIEGLDHLTLMLKSSDYLISFRSQTEKKCSEMMKRVVRHCVSNDSVMQKIIKI